MNQNSRATRFEQLISLLKDGKWHSSQEISEQVTLRFGHTVYEARKRGCQIEKHCTNSHFEYRILNPKSPAAIAQLLSLYDLRALVPLVLDQIPYLKLLILFGSRAKGTHNEDSDWDFVVLYDEKLRKQYEKGGWDWLRI